MCSFSRFFKPPSWDNLLDGGSTSEFGFPDGRIHTKRGTSHKVNALLRTYPYHAGKHAATTAGGVNTGPYRFPGQSHRMKSIPKIVSGGQTGADRSYAELSSRR